MTATTLVQFTLAELELDTYPAIHSTVQVSGGRTTGLPESFNRAVVVHSTFKQNQDSQEGIFGIIQWDYLRDQSERDLCLGRGLFQRPKTEVEWKSQLSPQSHRARDGSLNAVIFVSSPRITKEKIDAINLEYEESQKTQDIEGEPESLVSEKFQSSRSDWTPVEYAAEFERSSMEVDSELVRKSRSDLFFIADDQTVRDGSILAVFMLYQDPTTLDPIRLLRYAPSDAALMGMSLFTVGIENATPDEWPQDPSESAPSEEQEDGDDEEEAGNPSDGSGEDE